MHLKLAMVVEHMVDKDEDWRDISKEMDKEDWDNSKNLDIWLDLNYFIVLNRWQLVDVYEVDKVKKYILNYFWDGETLFFKGS
jgi:hypothetical protein